jgi:hypothetical protein
MDARMARAEWNHLPPGAQVLGADSVQSIAVFGRATTTNSTIYTTLPAITDLLKNPDPAAVNRDGFATIYRDQDWWKALSAQKQAALQQPCVHQVARVDQPVDEFRALLDIRGSK